MPHCSFNDSNALAVRLAGDVAGAIDHRLASQPLTGIVVSGGRTPEAFLRVLASKPLNWSRIRVTLADERRVPLADPASNLRMVQRAFAGTGAANSLVQFDAASADAVEQWQAELNAVPTPFAAVVLGMGDDGHFASLFPHMPGLAGALDAGGPKSIVYGVAPTEPRERLSLTLSWLLDTDLLALHVTGSAKLRSLQDASTSGSALEMPVRALLQQRRVPVKVYHAD